MQCDLLCVYLYEFSINIFIKISHTYDPIEMCFNFQIMLSNCHMLPKLLVIFAKFIELIATMTTTIHYESTFLWEVLHLIFIFLCYSTTHGNIIESSNSIHILFTTFQFKFERAILVVSLVLVISSKILSIQK